MVWSAITFIESINQKKASVSVLHVGGTFTLAYSPTTRTTHAHVHPHAYHTHTRTARTHQPRTHARAQICICKYILYALVCIPTCFRYYQVVSTFCHPVWQSFTVRRGRWRQRSGWHTRNNNELSRNWQFSLHDSIGGVFASLALLTKVVALSLAKAAIATNRHGRHLASWTHCNWAHNTSSLCEQSCQLQ